ncbi:hypothetical protein, partial [Pseudomonas helleri]|uniref:hypothetical protein n=1 Tax=Pseudomonas helleri TaxID=1608996 RepID=UPI001E560E2E
MSDGPHNPPIHSASPFDSGVGVHSLQLAISGRRFVISAIAPPKLAAAARTIGVRSPRLLACGVLLGLAGCASLPDE